MGCKVSKQVGVHHRPKIQPQQSHAPEQRPQESEAVCSSGQPDTAPQSLKEARAAGLKAKKELQAQQEAEAKKVQELQSNAKPQSKAKPQSNENLFEDSDFPAVVATLSTDISHQSYAEFKNAVWARPPEFMNCDYNEIKVFDTIDVNDISQGILGDCYFLASLSGLAENPKRIQQIFESSEINKSGKYSVKLFVQGAPMTVTIDDRFPCYAQNTQFLLFSKPKGKELWAIILEKAWAKLFKSYTNAEAGFIYEALENLTGGPSFHFATSQETEAETWAKIKEADQKKCVIGASSQRGNQDSVGIKSSHAYTIISVHEVGGHQLLKIRNPWGKFEWNGDFSDSSSLWTDQMKKAVQYQASDDGVFFMTVKDFRLQFIEYTIHHYDENWQYSYVQGKCNKKHANYYKFSTNKPCEVYFRIHQRDKRSENENYEYSPMAFMIAKMEKDGSYKLAVDGQIPKDPYLSAGARSLFLTRDGKIVLKEAGDYIIRVKARWVSANEDTLTVSAYSSGPSSLVQIPSVKDFQTKYFSAIALQNKQENQLTETSVIVSGSEATSTYAMVKNHGPKEINATITFTKLKNMRLSKVGKQSETKATMIIPAGSNKLIFLKSVDPSLAASFDWEWEFK